MNKLEENIFNLKQYFESKQKHPVIVKNIERLNELEQALQPQLSEDIESALITWKANHIHDLQSLHQVNLIDKETLNKEQEEVETLYDKIKDHIQAQQTKLDKIKEGINQINFNSLEEDNKILFGTIKSILEEE